jgi:hypothetical protein
MEDIIGRKILLVQVVASTVCLSQSIAISSSNKSANEIKVYFVHSQSENN